MVRPFVGQSVPENYTSGDPTANIARMPSPAFNPPPSRGTAMPYGAGVVHTTANTRHIVGSPSVRTPILPGTFAKGGR